MQIAEDPADLPSVAVGPSYLLELSWALHAAHKDYLRVRHPDLGALYAQRTGLQDRVLGFWDDGLICFTELQSLAHLSDGLRLTEPDEALAAVERELGKPHRELIMPSETAQDAAAANARLTRLSDDARLRRRFMSLITEVSEHLGDTWHDQRLPSVRATSQVIADRLADGGRWIDIVLETSSCCETFKAHRGQLVANVDAGSPLFLGVCAYFGSALYLNFDGPLVVGVGVEREDQAARSRTEELARQLKVLADPTRLAILDYVAPAPRSVTDIARAFQLAQPTVSNHVKSLRGAGLVTAERRGGRLEVQADRRSLANLVERLGVVVG